MSVRNDKCQKFDLMSIVIVERKHSIGIDDYFSLVVNGIGTYLVHKRPKNHVKPWISMHSLT